MLGFTYRVLFTIIIIFIVSTCFSQKNLYLNIEAGTGTAFVHLSDQQDYNLIEKTYYPSLTLGVAARYDFNKQLSGSIGLQIFNYAYASKFTRKDSLQDGNNWNFSLSNIETQRYLSLPILLQNNFNIRKSKPLYLYLLTGVNFGIKVDDLVSGIGVSQLNAAQDSIYGTYGTFNSGHRFSLTFILGTGLEWQTKNQSRYGFRIYAQAGVLRTFEGSLKLVEYEETYPYPHRAFEEEPEYKTSKTFGSYFSTNTSIFLTFYYAFNLRKKKKAKVE